MEQYQSLTDATPVSSSYLLPPRERRKKILKPLIEFTVQRHRCPKRLRPNFKTLEHFPSPCSSHPITNFHSLPHDEGSACRCSFFLVLHVQLPRKRLGGISKGKKKKNSLRRQASIRQRHGRMLGLSNQEFKTSVIKFLRSLVDKIVCKNRWAG